MRTKTLPAAVLVVVASAILGGLFGSRVLATQDRLDSRLKAYTAALAAIENEYVEPVDSTQVVYGSIDGMLRTLDPHSSFLTPNEYAQMRERQEGRYYGIGITINSVDGNITVVSLFEGSPAYRSGIRRNDVIARVQCAPAIAGQDHGPSAQPARPEPCMDDTKGWTTQDVVKRIKGPKGTSVNISIRRPGLENLIDLTVERDEINIVTVRAAFMMSPTTGYIRLQDFSETSDREIGDALRKLQTAGAKHIMLDLRENPGGPLDQAIAVANRFLKKGHKIVYTRGRVANADRDYVAMRDGDTTLPLIVLVNRNSASASEIVSGAMQDHDRGLIVGETTFGKALVQSVYTISNNAGLALTTGRYYTPSGRLIQRPWDGSFDEYLTYHLRDQAAARQHAPSDLMYTDSGRKVYSGGGIEPDHFIAGSVEGFTPTRFSRLMMGRGAFVGFAERFTKEGDSRPAARSANATHKVAQGFPMTDAIVAEFKQYLVSQGVKVDEAAFTADLPFIKAMIRYEVDSDLFSFEEARRNLSKVDPQVQAALGFFDEATKLPGVTRGS
jgi:carboxyl-terminal processing protease